MARGKPYDTKVIVQALVPVKQPAGDYEDNWVDAAPVMASVNPISSQDAARFGQRDWNILYTLMFPFDPLLTVRNRPGFAMTPTQLQFLAEDRPGSGRFTRVLTYKGGPNDRGGGRPVTYYGDQVGVRQQAPHG
jgi:hypothetical protein